MATAKVQLLTIGDVAAALRVHRSTVYGLVAAGQLRPVRLGKRQRFRESELERFVGRLETRGRS